MPSDEPIESNESQWPRVPRFRATRDLSEFNWVRFGASFSRFASKIGSLFSPSLQVFTAPAADYLLIGKKVKEKRL